MSDMTTRRSLIKSGIAATTIGLAGCSSNNNSGDGGGGKTTVSVSTAAGSSASELLAALQRVVNQQSDSVQIVAQEAPGDPGNVRLYNEGQVDAYTFSNYTAYLAANDLGPFAEEPIDKQAYQGLQIATYNLHWVATQNSGIENVDDLPGKKLFALPPSWGFRQMVENVHTEWGKWEDMKPGVLNLSTSDVPGAFDEGRVEASISYVTNKKGLTSFMREVSARQDLSIVQPTDGWVEAVENSPAVGHEEFDLVGYEGDLGSDTAHSMAQAAQLFFGPDVPRDAVYEIARISHESNDEIIKGFSQYLDHSDVENMHSLWLTDPNIPVHPGMADFVEENGNWNGDKYDRGELN